MWTIVALVVLNSGTIALAQSLPTPDFNGDYFSNEAPLKRKNPPPRLQAGSLWQVVSRSLNCRKAPGMDQVVMRQFKQNAILEAEVGRGGADEVLVNARDGNGKPWMPVRGKGFDDRCYVRANRQYIRPFIQIRNGS